VNFSFLLQLADSRSRQSDSASGRGQQALDMTLHTLRMMAHGGMHDHVGQVRIYEYHTMCSTTLRFVCPKFA